MNIVFRFIYACIGLLILGGLIALGGIVLLVLLSVIAVVAVVQWLRMRHILNDPSVMGFGMSKAKRDDDGEVIETEYYEVTEEIESDTKDN